MNGFSLLVALAAVGIDVGWEAGTDGQLRYTIRIEQVLLDPLREGQAIVSTVEQKDRGLVNFQIAAAARSGQRSPITVPAQANMVKYGWRPGENGGVDYLIQMTPERLETLAKGTPILGQIAPEVSDVRRFYIFVGVGDLPRESGGQSDAPQPPDLIRNDGGPLSQGTGRPGPLSDGSSFSDPSRYGGNGGVRESGSPQFRANAGQGGLRDSRGDALYQDDPRTSSSISNWSGPSIRNPQDNLGARYASDNRNASTGYGDANSGRVYEERFVSSSAPDPRDTGGQAYRPTSHPEQSYAAPAAVNHASAPPQAAPPTAAPLTNWPAAAVAQQQLPAVTPPARAEADAVRPWTPLILTTLALFASLGGNAYLGWLAWSFFWRYRDAASDVLRARQNSSRQAA